MPSTMIHLLVAYEINPVASDLFWFGNFAPDYINDRTLKDKIHFRDNPNRMEALRQFRKKFKNDNSFEAGWLLHLFVDACWDELMIPPFQQKYKDNPAFQDWFLKYRQEIGLASFYLYHHLEWTSKIWSQILNADLSTISRDVPITQNEAELYRSIVYKKHSESSIHSFSIEYSKDLIFDFSKKTAEKYIDWCRDR
ncbi:MAG: hypothetical protein BWY64_03677 [bacterium ADurb.Bin363]|nr:MAG: hypothetical protein BWY64_03677 [bacterium ADurb.Bin363]